MNFHEELLKNQNFDELFDRLTAYAAHKMNGFIGLPPEDLVSQTIEKVLNNTRDPDKANCSLEEFLFGCVKSEIYSLLKKKHQQNQDISEDAVQVITPLPDSEIEKTKALYLNELRLQGADEKEIELFCIWTEGVTKPQAVALELNWPISDVNNASRRLIRRINNLKHLTQYLV